MKSDRWLFCIYFFFAASLTVSLIACGGGGDGNNNYLPITNDTVIEYNGTEVLEYGASVTTTVNDHTSLENYGETDHVYWGLQDSTHDNLMKIVTVAEHGYPTNFSVASSRYFYNDSNDNIYLYLYETSGSFYPANPVDNVTGILYMPHRIAIGSSWGGPHSFLADGDYYVGNINFTVLGKEEIGVPFGSFDAVETFKIAFSGEYESHVNESTYKISAYGTIWIHPDIGVIKENETQERNISGSLYTVIHERHLSTINWAIN